MLLVVDDDDLARNVTARMLMTAGYLVLTAASGDDALRIVEDDLSGAVELVIADVMMPGMNGPEVAERLRQTSSAPTVLFISGATVPPVSPLLPGPYLQKPFSQQDLIQRVQELLRHT